MKIIKYQLCTEINRGTEDKPDIQQVFSSVTLEWNEGNEKIAKTESYNGEYTIEDDGKPEPVIPPTNEALAEENKRLKAQLASLTDTVDTLVLDALGGGDNV